MKLESIHTQYPQLEHEYEVYMTLAGGRGIPCVHEFVREAGYDQLIMQRLGPSLEHLFNACHRRFSLKTVLLLADQMVRRIITSATSTDRSTDMRSQITRLQFLHSRHFIHRDIKPENFLMGVGECAGEVYLIDFGLAKMYRDPITRRHIPCTGNRHFAGTVRYVSINVHLGLEQARRDDLESLGYVLIYLMRGFLPWQSYNAATIAERRARVGIKKIRMRAETLCRSLPVEFATYLNHVRTLRFDIAPDYSLLRNIFRDLFDRRGYVDDHVFDWSTMAS